MTKTPFDHRVYLGWITDLASESDPHTLWPSLRRDATLLADYERNLDTIAELDFSALCVWGLAASRDWPLDLSASLTLEKREFAAHLRRLTRARPSVAGRAGRLLPSGFNAPPLAARHFCGVALC